VFRYSLLAVVLLLCQCTTVKPRQTAHLDAAQFTASDAKRMPYTRWPAPPAKPTPKPRAVVICVHGLSGAASDFWPAGEHLSTRDLLVYGVQLRGMGNDPHYQQRGDLKRASTWQRDLLEFTVQIRQKHPGIPIYWYGESLGSLIVLHTLSQLPEQAATIDGVILAAPVIAFRHDLPWYKYWPIRLLTWIHPKKRISLESLGEQEVKVTSGTTHKEQMEKTPHYVEFFTLRLFRAVDTMVRRSEKAARRVQVPVLLLYTPNDVFTSQQQIESFFAQLGTSQKEKIIFPHSYHLILHDVDRAEALHHIEQWLERQIKH
jgi:acylglycerol lipase